MATERDTRRKRKAKGKLYGRVKPDNPTQSRGFTGEANKLGGDHPSGEAFSKALDKLVPKKDGTS